MKLKCTIFSFKKLLTVWSKLLETAQAAMGHPEYFVVVVVKSDKCGCSSILIKLSDLVMSESGFSSEPEMKLKCALFGFKKLLTVWSLLVETARAAMGHPEIFVVLVKSDKCVDELL